MDSKGVSEDWLSVWIGLLIFVPALGSLGGADILGWVVTTGVWSDLSKALNPVSKAYSGLGGMGQEVFMVFGFMVTGPLCSPASHPSRLLDAGYWIVDAGYVRAPEQ